MFRVNSTRVEDGSQTTHKVLLYSHHGFGKTYQCRFFEKRYGKGLILSGESGLKSVEDVSIDYIEFKSYDGPHDPEKNVYSFRQTVGEILRSIKAGEFPYAWIAVDSLTELGHQCLKHHQNEQSKLEKKDGGWQVWGDYKASMLGALTQLRDMPCHVYVTCLAKEEDDTSTGLTHYWPALQSSAVAKEAPAVFDHVFCGVRSTEKSDSTVKVSRYIITEELDGWHGKARDPRNTLAPMEKVSDITELLERITKGE